MPAPRPRVSINGYAGAIGEVFGYWRKVMGKDRSRIDDRREQALARAFAIGYSISDLKLAIDGCRASRWHMGENDRRVPYNDLELITRDACHIDRFMADGEKAQQEAASRRQRYTAANEVPESHRGPASDGAPYRAAMRATLKAKA